MLTINYNFYRNKIQTVQNVPISLFEIRVITKQTPPNGHSVHVNIKMAAYITAG